MSVAHTDDGNIQQDVIPSAGGASAPQVGCADSGVAQFAEGAAEPFFRDEHDHHRHDHHRHEGGDGHDTSCSCAGADEPLPPGFIPLPGLTPEPNTLTTIPGTDQPIPTPGFIPLPNLTQEPNTLTCDGAVPNLETLLGYALPGNPGLRAVIDNQLTEATEGLPGLMSSVADPTDDRIPVVGGSIETAEGQEIAARLASGQLDAGAQELGVPTSAGIDTTLTPDSTLAGSSTSEPTGLIVGPAHALGLGLAAQPLNLEPIPTPVSGVPAPSIGAELNADSLFYSATHGAIVSGEAIQNAEGIIEEAKEVAVFGSVLPSTARVVDGLRNATGTAQRSAFAGNLNNTEASAGPAVVVPPPVAENSLAGSSMAIRTTDFSDLREGVGSTGQLTTVGTDISARQITATAVAIGTRNVGGRLVLDDGGHGEPTDVGDVFGAHEAGAWSRTLGAPSGRTDANHNEVTEAGGHSVPHGARGAGDGDVFAGEGSRLSSGNHWDGQQHFGSQLGELEGHTQRGVHEVSAPRESGFGSGVHEHSGLHGRQEHLPVRESSHEQAHHEAMAEVAFACQRA